MGDCARLTFVPELGWIRTGADNGEELGSEELAGGSFGGHDDCDLRVLGQSLVMLLSELQDRITVNADVNRRPMATFR